MIFKNYLLNVCILCCILPLKSLINLVVTRWLDRDFHNHSQPVYSSLSWGTSIQKEFVNMLQSSQFAHLKVRLRWEFRVFWVIPEYSHMQGNASNARKPKMHSTFSIPVIYQISKSPLDIFSREKLHCFYRGDALNKLRNFYFCIEWHREPKLNLFSAICITLGNA